MAKHKIKVPVLISDKLEVSSHFGPYSQVFIKAIALLRN